MYVFLCIKGGRFLWQTLSAIEIRFEIASKRVGLLRYLVNYTV